jgi:hypothetical protein
VFYIGIRNNYYIEKINKNQAKELIIKYHYLGVKGFRSKFNYGLFNKENDSLIGVAIFHNVSAPETVVGAFGLDRKQQEGIYELGRLVLLPDYNGGNYTSFLVSNAIKQLRKETNTKALISYATSDRHVGYVYQACNFKYYGLTAIKKDFWFNGKIQERGSTKDKEGVWINRPRKHRYALVFDKALNIKWEEESYPKQNIHNQECYGCKDTGIIVSRKKEYPCILCNKIETRYLEGFSEAFLGYERVDTEKFIVKYDEDMCIKVLEKEHEMSHEEAIEYFHYNVYGAVNQQHAIFI